MRKQRTAVQQLVRQFLSSLFAIILITGVVEGLVVKILNVYQNLGHQLTDYQEVAVDVVLVVVMTTPLLWFFVLRKLARQIIDEQENVAKKVRLNTELRNAIDAHALVSITDAQGHIIYANDRFCQISGYSSDELLGKDHRIINSGYHDKLYIRKMWDTITSGQVWQGVFCNRCKDGNLRWADTTIMPMLDENNRIYQYISIRRDITAQKEADAELIMLKRAVNACSDMILITNVDGHIQYANPALCQSTGWDELVLIGRDPSILDSPKADIETLTNMRKALKKRQTWSGRLLEKRKGIPQMRILNETLAPDPLEFWAELTITPVLNRDGSAAGYVQIQRDITEQIIRETAQHMENDDTAARLEIARILQQDKSLKERFADVLDVLFELNTFNLQRKAGIFLRANDEDYIDLFLLTGEFSEDFIRKEQRIPLGSCLCGRAAVSGDLLVSDDCFCDPRHEHKFDDMQTHGHYIVPISVTGNVLGVLFLYTNPYPTQNDKRLAMLKQVGEMLALAVFQDQVRISLEKARDMATQAALAKSEFLANMSHEIRTPMNGVLGMLELLRDTNMTRSQWDLVETAHASAEALLAILNDILDFSKLEAGKVDIEHISFNLPSLIEDVCALLAGRAHTKGLELNCFMPIDMPRYWKGDPTRIRQVLTNLVGNAIKFTKEGEVSVNAVIIPSPDGTDHCRIEITDTGVGIPNEAQERLFQPFTQAESTTVRCFGGTGLGLSISKNLVDLMGGSIGFNSIFGQGSTFWFTLPLVLSEVPEVYEQPTDIIGKRVLVVDDNATNRTILQHYLIHWGFVVGQADSGRAAIAKLEEAITLGSPFDLALLDMHMPEMDGLTLARIITESAVLKGMPLILLSSGGVIEDNVRQAVGLSQSLLKPVKQSQLFDAIANSLHSSRFIASENIKMPTSTMINYQGKKLLVVEDNKVNQKVISGMLARFLIVPEIADNGRIALDKLVLNNYDLVLMDCQMPVLDGYEATQELRKLEFENNLPRQTVVAITAHAAAGEREKCLVAGMDDYLTKPITKDNLEKILLRWLGNQSNETEQTNYKEDVIEDKPLLWNKTAALDYLGGDEDLLNTMIVSFIEETPNQLLDLQTAQQQSNLSAMADLAHAIKGSVSYLCADKVRDHAAQLEHATRNKQSMDYQEMTMVLIKMVNDLVENLRESLLSDNK